MKKEKNITSQVYLPHHMVIPILENLPPKSLIRFLCVSKTFNSSIHNFSFISFHLKKSITFSDPNKCQNILYTVDNHSSSTRLMLYNETKGSLFASYDFSKSSDIHNVVGYCNGVVCLFEMGSKSFYFWNPLFNKYVRHTPKHFSFDFSTCLGFGYNSRTNHFKLLQVNPFVAKLYTISSIGNANRWRIYKIAPPQIHGSLDDKFSSAYVNERLHWLVNNYSNASFASYIMSFDMKDEVFRELDLPYQCHLNKARVDLKVTEFKGMLCVLPCYFNSDVPFTIWAMKDYGEEKSWIPLHEIRLHSSPKAFRFQVVGWKNEGKLWGFKDTSRPRLHVFDHKTKTFCKGKKFPHYSVFRATYTESLAFMDVEDEK